jgi:hypothetical protein
VEKVQLAVFPEIDPIPKTEVDPALEDAGADAAGCGFERNDERERAATAKDTSR